MPVEANCKSDLRYIYMLIFFKSRMKPIPPCFSYRDRDDGRRGETKEAGGRQSKGRIVRFGCSNNSVKQLLFLQRTRLVILQLILTWLGLWALFCGHPPPFMAASQLSDRASMCPALTAGGWEQNSLSLQPFTVCFRIYQSACRPGQAN